MTRVVDWSSTATATMISPARTGVNRPGRGWPEAGVVLPCGAMETVYEAAGGELGMLVLARAWHERVMIDEVVAHAFAQGFRPDHTERLAAYWGEALGGPPTYTERYGDETAVVRMHSGNGPHEEMDRRAVACFDEALSDSGFGDDERLRAALHDYFAWATTTTMARYHHSADDVPRGLRIPQWSWDGLVEAPGSGAGSGRPPQAETE